MGWPAASREVLVLRSRFWSCAPGSGFFDRGSGTFDSGSRALIEVPELRARFWVLTIEVLVSSI